MTRYLLGANGMTKLSRTPDLPVGTKVIGSGYAGNLQTFIVYDKLKVVEYAPEGYTVDEYSIGGYFSPLSTLDEYTRSISEQYGIGFYYDLSAELFTMQDIERSINRALDVQTYEATKKKAEAEQREKDRQRFAELYPYLNKVEKYDEKAAVNNIRKLLKHKFPKVKFSVTSKNSVRIRWTDGYLMEDVREELKKFDTGRFDSYQDLAYTESSAFNDLFGGVEYLFFEREQSPESYNEMKAEVEKDYPSLIGKGHINFDEWYKEYHLNVREGDLKIASRRWVSIREFVDFRFTNKDFTR